MDVTCLFENEYAWETHQLGKNRVDMPVSPYTIQVNSVWRILP
jgi:hypothetical protein